VVHHGVEHRPLMVRTRRKVFVQRHAGSTVMRLPLASKQPITLRTRPRLHRVGV
jgi:hypothetical protein